jgi:hypothetical protein
LRVVSFKLGDDEYRALAERARREGVSVSEVLRVAVRSYLGLPTQSPSCDEVLGRLGELEKRIIALEQAVFKQAGASPPQTADQSSKSKRTAWDVLREQEIACVSNMKGVRDPEKIVESLKEKGAVILVSENDRCAVYPDTWMSFVESLAKVSSPDEREVLGRLKGKAKQLFRMLRAAGAVHYESKTRRWVVDPSVVEEAGRAPGPAGGGGEAVGAGHVLRIPVEEAGDPERYVAEMERRGWLCNEVARQVICVWRETLEQAVVDLNSAGAGAKDMEKALAGDGMKLEVAKAAHEAGLLWYSSQEKRWKAAL